MHLDQHGLPVQVDNDPLDQLNRVGILGLSDFAWFFKLNRLAVHYPFKGVFVRYVGGNPNNVSGDQLVPVFAACMVHEDKSINQMTLALFKRLGFAQNTHDTDGSRKVLPDFLLHRVLPFIARVYAPKLSLLADVVLFANTLVTVIDLRVRNNPDHVDPFVNACVTLYATNVYRPTYLSKLSARMLDDVFKRGRMASYKNGEWIITANVADALRWYHRAASGGNPEVGEVQVGHWNEVLKIARS